MPVFAAAVALILVGAGPAAAPHAAMHASRAPIQRAVVFEPNVGQFEPGVRYRAHVAGGWLSMTDTAVELLLGPTVGVGRSVRVRPAGASSLARPLALDRLAGVINHFESAASSAWHANVPTFRRVRYAAVYPGIDLVYHGSPDQLEYDFVVDPGADPSRIAMRFDGADRVEIDPAGDLVIHAGDAVLRQRPPDAWQDVGRQRRRVDARYRLTTGGDVALTIGDYDRGAPLVVDPILLYSSYLHSDTFHVAVDAAGNMVIATEQVSYAKGLKVERLSPDGQTIYSTLIGGSSDYITVAGVATAADGSAVVAATTGSANLPLVNASQAYPGDTEENGFVVKLSPSGDIVFSTYLGGTSYDTVGSVSVNATGTIAVAGGTSSQDFPGIDGFVSGPTQGFITLFSPTGSRMHGALLPAGIQNVVVDAGGSVYVTSETSRRNWPTTPTSFQPTSLQATCLDDSYYPCREGVLAKLSADLRSLVYSTYIHPTDPRAASSDLRLYELAVDPTGSAYILASGAFGTTPGAMFPECLPNSFCLFLAKLNPAGSGLVYSTYLQCCTNAIQVDARGNVYLAGTVEPTLTGFAPTANAQQPDPGDAHLFVTTDGGATWHPRMGVYVNGLFDALVHTTDQVLYSAYSNYPKTNLFKSTDLGEHWQLIDGDAWYPPVIVAGNPNVWYEGPVGRLLRRSIDGGATWTTVSTPVDPWSFAVDAIDGQTLYLGGYQGAFKSVNGGFAWSPITAIPGGLFASLVVSPANRDLVFARNSNGWFRSADGGAQWTSAALPNDQTFYWFTFDPLDAMRIYANNGGTVLRSVNGGVSWTPFITCYCSGVAVSHSPDLALFVRSSEGLAKVADTGAAVSALPPPMLRDGQVWGLLADPLDPRTMVALADGFSDAFVSVLDPTGSRIRYASYFGGSDREDSMRMALGAGGTLAILGRTRSRDLPLVNPQLPDRGGELEDSFVALMRIPLPTVVVDAPTDGVTLSTFTVSGWAIDTGAPIGAGIDAVHVWAVPQSGGAPIFVGTATYGAARADVASAYGPQFANSGFSLTGATLPPGAYTLAVFARSTLSGTFDATMRSIQVQTGGHMSVDMPAPGGLRYQPFTIAGWAFDAAAPSGTGIDAVHVWASRAGELRFVGAASIGLSRPDIGALFGSRFANAGFALQASGLAPGDWMLTVFARNTATGRFDLAQTVPVTIPDGGAAAIDLPSTGSAVSGPFVVAGWAIDRQGAGTGVDAVHVWAAPDAGGAPIFLGVAISGLPRPDIAALYGDPRFTPSGYGLPVNSLPPGTYTVVVFAHSLATGTFSIVRTVRVAVNF